MNQENWEWVDIELLKTDGENPNIMSKAEKEALWKNITRFGWNMPIITDLNYLIADGEQKYMVAKEKGVKQVPILKKDINDTERRILRQSMNKLRGTHSEELDAKEYTRILEAVDMEEFVSLTGISEQDILNHINKANQETQNAVEEVSKLGGLVVKCPQCGHEFKRE